MSAMRIDRLNNSKRPACGAAAVISSLTMLCLFVAELQAQRAVALQISRTNETQTLLTWQSSSVVPPPGLSLFAGFQAQRSLDLREWEAIGERHAGGVGGGPAVLRVLDDRPPPKAAFYRVKSVIDFPYADLIGENLEQGELAEANLFGANLFSAQLDAADLSGADLRGADLRFATLTNATCRGANLFGARLVGAAGSDVDFSGADLSFADLDGAELLGANFRGADLRAAVLTAAELRFATFHETRIEALTVMDARSRLLWEIVNEDAAGRDLRNTDLSFADVSGADLRRADLRSANLFGTFAVEADFTGANLTGATIDFLDLRDAKLDTNTMIAPKGRLIWEIVNPGVAGRDLRNAMLNRAILAEGDLSRCNLTGANFTSTFLNGASLKDANLTSAVLVEANLTDADLSGANLTRANLRNATSEGTDFSNAVFSQTTMPDGTIRNR